VLSKRDRTPLVANFTRFQGHREYGTMEIELAVTSRLGRGMPQLLDVIRSTVDVSVSTSGVSRASSHHAGDAVVRLV